MPMPSGRIRVIALKCEQCGHIWLPRSDERPGLCPKCKSLRWDKPKREPLTPGKIPMEASQEDTNQPNIIPTAQLNTKEL